MLSHIQGTCHVNPKHVDFAMQKFSSFNDKCQVFMVLSRAVFPGARFTSLDLRGVHLIIQDADYNLCLETIESPSQQVRATVCLRETCLLHKSLQVS